MKTIRSIQYTVLMAALCAALIACTTLNPFAIAKTPEEQGWAALKVYDGILRTQVLPAMKDEGIPVEIRKALGDANRAGTPAVVALERVIGEYSRVKAEVLSGHSTEEQLTILTGDLTSATQAVLSAITEYKAQLKQVKHE